MNGQMPIRHNGQFHNRFLQIVVVVAAKARAYILPGDLGSRLYQTIPFESITFCLSHGPLYDDFQFCFSRLRLNLPTG